MVENYSKGSLWVYVGDQQNMFRRFKALGLLCFAIGVVGILMCKGFLRFAWGVRFEMSRRECFI